MILRHSGRKPLLQLIVHRQNSGHLEKMSIGTMKLFIEMFFQGKSFSRSALVHTNVKQGLTGDIEFTANGERIQSFYDVINIQHGQSVVVGTYRSNTVSDFDRKRFPVFDEIIFLMRISIVLFSFS